MLCQGLALLGDGAFGDRFGLRERPRGARRYNSADSLHGVVRVIPGIEQRVIVFTRNA